MSFLLQLPKQAAPGGGLNLLSPARAAMAALLLAGCSPNGSHQSIDAPLPQPTNGLQPAIVPPPRPAISRVPLPTEFAPPAAPTNFVWLDPKFEGGFSPQMQVTLNHAVSFMSALWKSTGDPRYRFTTNLTIVATTAQPSADSLGGEHFACAWRFSTREFEFNTNYLPHHAKTIFGIMISVGHELIHAIDTESLNRKLNLAELLATEQRAYAAGAQDALVLKEWLLADGRNRGVPERLQNAWQAVLSGERAHQLYELRKVEVRAVLLQIAQSCQDGLDLPPGQLDGLQRNNLRAMYDDSLRYIKEMDFNDDRADAISNLATAVTLLSTHPQLIGILHGRDGIDLRRAFMAVKAARIEHDDAMKAADAAIVELQRAREAFP